MNTPALLRHSDLNHYPDVNSIGRIMIRHRPRQTDADVSSPRLAGMKEPSCCRVKNTQYKSPPKGSTFCFANVGEAKSLCVSRERSERVANRHYPLLGLTQNRILL